MSKKIDKINNMYEKVINSNFNLLDLVIAGRLSKCQFEGKELSRLYSDGRFNGHCQIGSLLCIIALNDDDCKLIRGELLPDTKGEDFFHGWIETKVDDKEFVIDVSMARAVPKEVYYRYLKPRVDAVVTRQELFENDYVRFLDEALRRDNRLDMGTLYEVWWPYEDDNLINIDDNTRLDPSRFEKPAARRRKKPVQKQEEA